MAAVPQLSRFRIDVKENGVAEIVMNRAKKLNVMDDVFFEEIGPVFDFIESSPDVNVALLWAEGRLFTAGLDLKSMGSVMGSDDDELTQRTKLLAKLKLWQTNFNRARTITKPVIAAIHGKCIGGGIDMITSCDVRLATKDASFSIKETEIGLVADLGTLQRIHRIVGSGIAREMAFTADFIDAQRALSSGFVNAVYDDQDALLAAARAMAARIAGLSPIVLQGTKIAMNFAEDHTVEDSLNQIALWNSAFLKSDDLVEAVTAFMQKRTPKFRNRL